jgi:hypothetical protein
VRHSRRLLFEIVVLDVGLDASSPGAVLDGELAKAASSNVLTFAGGSNEIQRDIIAPDGGCTCPAPAAEASGQRHGRRPRATLTRVQRRHEDRSAADPSRADQLEHPRRGGKGIARRVCLDLPVRCESDHVAQVVDRTGERHDRGHARRQRVAQAHRHDAAVQPDHDDLPAGRHNCAGQLDRGGRADHVDDDVGPNPSAVRRDLLRSLRTGSHAAPGAQALGIGEPLGQRVDGDHAGRRHDLQDLQGQVAQPADADQHASRARPQPVPDVLDRVHRGLAGVGAGISKFLVEANGGIVRSETLPSARPPSKGRWMTRSDSAFAELLPNPLTIGVVVQFGTLLKQRCRF